MTGWFKQLKSQTYPLDRLALGLICLLSVVVGLLVLAGDRTYAKVREFSWAQQTVGAEDTAFTLTFNRPMNWQSVTQQLQIAPPLPGKTSWSGKRFAYTLTQPIPYGQSFQLQLAQATSSLGATLEPFSATFKSRDLAFAYIGVNGDEAGRLILYNQTRSQKTILTPPNLAVLRFKAYPKGDRLLFTATERSATSTASMGEMNAKLYRVTTGLASDSKSGDLETVLDNSDAQILKFDLSADGERIVWQQATRQNMSETGLWQKVQDKAPERINIAGTGDFLIAPDSQTVVVAQGQGLAVVPLNQNGSGKSLDFLPQFGMVLNFARDGSAATMVKFNTDYTRSLYLVANPGTPTELLRIKGSILSTIFTAQRDALYCLLTRVLPGKDYREVPYLVKIDLKTRQQTELFSLSNQRDVSISLAPDNATLLFDQALTGADNRASVADGMEPRNLWALNLNSQTAPATPTIVTAGTAPQWLP